MDYQALTAFWLESRIFARFLPDHPQDPPSGLPTEPFHVPLARGEPGMAVEILEHTFRMGRKRSFAIRRPRETESSLTLVLREAHPTVRDPMAVRPGAYRGARQVAA